MLNRQARNAVAELARAGVDDLTADEIVRLHVLGEALDRALKDSEVVIASLPVRVGGVTLWPPTCAAEDWLERADRWFEDRPVPRFWALPLALAHGREPGWFDENAGDEDSALDAIYEFHRGIAATEDEVSEAVTRLFRLKHDGEREEARAALLAWTDWASRRDPAGEWRRTREKGLAALKADEEASRPSNAAEGASPGRERSFAEWRVYCAELAVLSGTDLAAWYGEDMRLVTHAMAKAIEANRSRTGGTGGGTPSVPKRERDALLALRAAVADIKKSRGKG